MEVNLLKTYLLETQLLVNWLLFLYMSKEVHYREMIVWGARGLYNPRKKLLIGI